MFNKHIRVKFFDFVNTVFNGIALHITHKKVLIAFERGAFFEDTEFFKARKY